MEIDEIYKNNTFQFVTKEDIEEIKRIIKYAKGLIIHDKNLADSLETIYSLEKANNFITKILSLNNEDNKEDLIKSYSEIESNPYYKNLYQKYNIDFYTSRTANDYAILKSTNNELNKEEKNMFHQSYYESLFYFNKVTRTEAFKDDKYNRSWEEMYLIFCTILRYINKKMFYFYNVDTYNNYHVKNTLLSYGLDYFDDIPLNYKKRLLKVLDDLIRKKGTDNIFDIILNIFSNKSINIYKYTLCKTNIDCIDISNNYYKKLLFYRTEYNKNLDIENNLFYNFETITNLDPFWMATEQEASSKDFHTTKTKYISIDVTMDILKNTYKLSYFLSFLNKLEIEHNKRLNIFMEKNKSLDYNNIKLTKGKENESFYFLDKNISKKYISLFDSFILLISLILKFHGFKDNIIKNNDSINYLYSYNNINDNLDIIKFINDIKIILEKNKKYLSDDEIKNITDFINSFRLKNFYKSTEIDSETIIKKYKSNNIYKEELYILFDNIKDHINNKINNSNSLLEKNFYQEKINKLKNYLLKNDVLSFLDEVYFLLIKNYINIYYLGINNDNILNIFSEFISFKFFKKEIKEEDLDKLINYNDEEIFDEYIKYFNDIIYIINLNNNEYLSNNIINEINNSLDNFEKEKNYNNLKNLIKLMNKTLDLLEINYDNSSYKLINIFNTLFIDIDKYEKILFSMKDFLNIFNYNENLRENLENLILKTNDKDLYKNLKKIWDIKFTGDFNTELFDSYDTFSDYLKSKDYYLYQYCNSFSNNDEEIDLPEKRRIIKNKIFEVCQDIENCINNNSFNFLNDNTFIGISEYIKNYIKEIILVFKSYTITLLDTSSILLFDDKLNNHVKMFDTLENKQMDLYNNDSINLNQFLDFEYEFSDLKENLIITDEIKIIEEE